MLTLMRLGWGQENQAFRQMFTSQFIPDANKEQADWFNELQQISSSAEDAARNLLANGQVEISSLLPQVECRLSRHALPQRREDAVRRRAAGWPRNSRRRFARSRRNHIMLEGEPALARFLDELRILPPISNTKYILGLGTADLFFDTRRHGFPVM